MRPVTFARSEFIPRQAEAIAAEIADVARWSEFGGYGPLPGIASATYERRTNNMVGSLVRVCNTDGSEHVEEIRVWKPATHIEIKLHEFTPPLHLLATHFVETWRFREREGGTMVTRTVAMYSRQPAAWPLLWLVSLLLRRAIGRHLTGMAR